MEQAGGGEGDEARQMSFALGSSEASDDVSMLHCAVLFCNVMCMLCCTVVYTLH